MTSDAVMEAELASILADPTFVRSPVLARLLTYLVETTARGDGPTLKSYSVAVDGLGRCPESDPQVDTYARVQVARLRKALDGFYQARGATRSERLTIDSGSYEVKVAPNGPAPAVTQPGLLPRVAMPGTWLAGNRSTGILVAAGLAALLAIAIAVTLHWQAQSQAALERWRTPNAPSVIVDVEDNTKGRPNGGYADVIRQELLMRIGRYQGLRVYYDTAVHSSYAINVSLYDSGKDLLANTFVIDRRNNRVLWSGAEVIGIDAATENFRTSDYIARTAFTIAQGTGIIHSAERRRNPRSDTPYGCWLRFTAGMPNNVVGDPALADCAAEWHAAAPDNPTAAALYAWTLLDQSIVLASAGDRRQLIEEALETLESARALNPTSGIVPAVAMRGYAFAGEELALRTAVDQALQLNPGNLEIEGLAGTMLVFRNDPRGEAIVDDAIAQHSNPPPWYFVAKFVAAMMREDTAGAGKALGQLKPFNHMLPVLPVLTAAYQARSGQLDEARASWERAKAAQPILRVDPDIFFERTPLGPAVIARLKTWLAPVTN